MFMPEHSEIPGWKDSFFGILHGQGKDAVEFYTESKIVVERWSRQETRKF